MERLERIWSLREAPASLAVRAGGKTFRATCNLIPLSFKDKTEENAYFDRFLSNLYFRNSIGALLTLFLFTGLFIVSLRVPIQIDTATYRQAVLIARSVIFWILTTLASG